jgi:hypothetical protein
MGCTYNRIATSVDFLLGYEKYDSTVKRQDRSLETPLGHQASSIKRTISNLPHLADCLSLMFDLIAF